MVMIIRILTPNEVVNIIFYLTRQHELYKVRFQITGIPKRCRRRVVCVWSVGWSVIAMRPDGIGTVQVISQTSSHSFIAGRPSRLTRKPYRRYMAKALLKLLALPVFGGDFELARNVSPKFSFVSTRSFRAHQFCVNDCPGVREIALAYVFKIEPIVN